MSTEATKTETIPVPPGLTRAQEAVYRLVVQGFNSREIAKEINRSIKTVENHRYAINKALRIESPAALLIYHFETLVIPALEAEIAALKAKGAA